MFGAFRALRCFAVWFLRIPRCNFHTRPRSGHGWRRWWSELSWGIELEGQPFSLSGFASHLSMLCLESNGFVNPKRSIHGETAGARMHCFDQVSWRSQVMSKAGNVESWHFPNQTFGEVFLAPNLLRVSPSTLHEVNMWDPGSAGPGSYFFVMPKTIQSMCIHIYIYNDVRYFLYDCMHILNFSILFKN